MDILHKAIFMKEHIQLTLLQVYGMTLTGLL